MPFLAPVTMWHTDTPNGALKHMVPPTRWLSAFFDRTANDGRRLYLPHLKLIFPTLRGQKDYQTWQKNNLTSAAQRLERRINVRPMCPSQTTRPHENGWQGVAARVLCAPGPHCVLLLVSARCCPLSLGNRYDNSERPRAQLSNSSAQRTQTHSQLDSKEKA